MIATISEFWNQNGTSIIISLIVGFIFFVLGPIGLWFSGKKIRKERIKKAKETLLDLLESMIVNKAEINPSKLRSLFDAVERDNDIDLTGQYGLKHWLGDVTLRFEKSRHLSSAQKHEYYKQVQEVLSQLEAEKEEAATPSVPRKYETIITDLRTAIDKQDRDTANASLKELEQSIANPTPSQDLFLNVFRMYSRMYKRGPIAFWIASAIVVVVYVLIIVAFTR